MVTLYSSIYVI